MGTGWTRQGPGWVGTGCVCVGGRAHGVLACVLSSRAEEGPLFTQSLTTGNHVWCVSRARQVRQGAWKGWSVSPLAALSTWPPVWGQMGVSGGDPTPASAHTARGRDAGGGVCSPRHKQQRAFLGSPRTAVYCGRVLCSRRVWAAPEGQVRNEAEGTCGRMEGGLRRGQRARVGTGRACAGGGRARL